MSGEAQQQLEVGDTTLIIRGGPEPDPGLRAGGGGGAEESALRLSGTQGGQHRPSLNPSKETQCPGRDVWG